MTPLEIVTPILVSLLGGGGLVALIKLRPEAAMVTVQGAERVIIIQKDEITRLQESVEEARFEAGKAQEAARTCTEAIERLEEEVGRLREELADTRAQRDELAEENTRLKATVHTLQERVDELERQQGIRHPEGSE